MRCAWKELLSVLPDWLRAEVDRRGRDSLQEIRLRVDRPVYLHCQTGVQRLNRNPTKADMQFIINMASKYSPWLWDSVGDGYITAPGGHRIGICGECVMQKGVMTGIRTPTSLCIRVARDVEGIAPSASQLRGCVLLIGPPGSGKTTLLRDMIRQISSGATSVSVVDERGELFPVGGGFLQGDGTDVLSGCGKPHGIEVALKTMNPKWIAVDEITSAEDCLALEQASWCGVRLLATAHAANLGDLLGRGIYRPLVKEGLFETLVVLKEDKSWHLERMRV